jgi:hypothetical protein
MTKKGLRDRQLEHLIEWFNEVLSGSGFNGEWTGRRNGKSFSLFHDFYCMDSLGYYDGYAKIRVIIDYADYDREDWSNFRLAFIGAESQEKNKKHFLQDYIEDSVFNCLAYGLRVLNSQEIPFKPLKD